jgi:histidine phosphotransferase ChpT
MTTRTMTDDLDLAAIMASRICHDLIGPVTGIFTSLEVLDDDDDPQSRAYALEVIRAVTEQAKAKVEFARLAYGAGGSAGATIDATLAEQIARGYVGNGRHRLSWQLPKIHVAKDRLKLLLNMIATAMTALPRGGEIRATAIGNPERPEFEVRCIGVGAKLPLYLGEFLSSDGKAKVEPVSVQAYYTYRLAKLAGLRLTAQIHGVDTVLAARA